ncbi:MAG: PQQ-like beta-propeller repeat protein [Acidobacteria bacterium]|nr:PQQ-like beta-propeller repeat protein [Acidobacteriota bacterium]
MPAKKLIFCFAALSVVPVLAADWPQWRGPNRDGVVRDFALPASWPATVKEQWKIHVGEGHSSPVMAGSKVYLLARQGEEEVVLCVDAATGRQIWRASYPASYTMNPAATGHGKGPKSTPVVSTGKLLTFGINGVLSCFDASSGMLKWRKEFSKQYPSTSPLYGTAMSPIVVAGLCIAHVGGHDKGALTAFDVATGAVKWTYDGDGPAYSSPVLATLAGESQLITYTQNDVVGVSAGSGKLLWKVSAKRAYDTNSVSPVVYKDLVIFSLDQKGIGAVRVAKQQGSFVADQVWRNPDLESYMSTPVLDGNRLLGFSYRKKGQFFCLNADTGQALWESPGRMGENAAILNAGEVFFLLTDEAKLIVLKSKAPSYLPVKEYQVAGSPTWAHPVLAGNRILVKDKTSLAALEF